MHELMHHSHKDGSKCLKDDCRIIRLLHDGQSATVEHEVFWRKDGSTFPVSYLAYPVIVEGAVQGEVVTFMDITEQLQVKDRIEALKGIAGLDD